MSLSHSIQIHELSLSNLFDRALGASLTESTVDSAAQKFVDVLAEEKNLIGTDRIHIRLATEDGLKLVAGFGPYFEAAKMERHIIWFDDSSPTARTFRDKQSRWVNRVDDDKESNKFVVGLPDGRTKQVLKGEQSYVNLLIGTRHGWQALGVITLSSPKPWFFSESMLRSMKALGHRLYFALKHAEQVESERQRSKEVAFLMNTTPKLSTELDLRTSLRENAERIAYATSAEKVSFFLSNDKQDALILQGYFGWKEDMVGRAEYRIGEGMTGTIAEMKGPKYIPDLVEWKQNNAQGPAKYEKEMFGAKSEDARYEVIGIPLRFGGLLGILTLQNTIEQGSTKSKFTTVDEIRPFLDEPLVYKQISSIKRKAHTGLFIVRGTCSFEAWETAVEGVPPPEGFDPNVWDFFEIHREVKPSDRYAFDGDVVVLMDRRSGSATETYLDAVKRTGIATLVGQRSVGAGGGYIIAPVMRLPASGMIFRMEGDLDINPDGTFLELTGVQPDVELPSCPLPDRADKKTLLKDPWIQAVINGLNSP